MASSQPFPSRSSYAGGKLPDRTLNTHPLPLSSSAFATRRERVAAGGGSSLGGADFGPAGDATGGGSGQGMGRGMNSMNINMGMGMGGMGVNAPAPPVHARGQQAQNALNELTEEQREEINEAVREFVLLVSKKLA